MTARKSILNSLHILKACPVGWDEMAGDTRNRYCETCNKRVYNLSEMTREEGEAIVEAYRARVCVRLVRNADGTIQTREVATVPDRKHGALARRASPLAAAAVTTLLSAGAGASFPPPRA